MHFLINGIVQPFTELKAFRAIYDLPEAFGVALFEPKDYTGLGRIDHAGVALHELREAVLAQTPTNLPPQAWLSEQPRLQTYFHQELLRINPEVGLRDPEVGFASSGFGDVLQAVIYARIRAQAAHTPPPSFDQIYMDWLNDSVRVSSLVHEYQHQEEVWQIQVITNVYGRIGLLIQTPSIIQYVLDGRLACPAEGFMVKLLREVAARILEVTV